MREVCEWQVDGDAFFEDLNEIFSFFKEFRMGDWLKNNFNFSKSHEFIKTYMENKPNDTQFFNIS